MQLKKRVRIICIGKKKKNRSNSEVQRLSDCLKKAFMLFF